MDVKTEVESAITVETARDVRVVRMDSARMDTVETVAVPMDVAPWAPFVRLEELVAMAVIRVVES